MESTSDELRLVTSKEESGEDYVRRGAEGNEKSRHNTRVRCGQTEDDKQRCQL